MSWTHTENKERCMEGLKTCYSWQGYAWLRQVFSFNFKRIGVGYYMKYREGDLDKIEI